MEKLAEGLTNSNISIIAGNKKYFYPKTKGFALDKVDFFIGLTSVINVLIPRYLNCAFDLKRVLGITGSKIDSGKESIRIIIPEECATEFLWEWNKLCIKEEPVKVRTSELNIKLKKGTIDWEKSKKEIDEVFDGTRESTGFAMSEGPFDGPKIEEVVEVREDDKGNKKAKVILFDKETIEKILKDPKVVVIPKKEEEKKEYKKTVQDAVVKTEEKKTPKKKKKASKND